jgi:hypothetical protein
MATVNEDIRVRIQGVIDGLPQFKAFANVLGEIKTHGTTRVNFDTSAAIKSKGDVGQLSEEIHKLAAAIEKLDGRSTGGLGRFLTVLAGVATILGHLKSAHEGVGVIKELAVNAPNLSAKIAGAGTAISGFFALARDKLSGAASTIKTKIASAVEDLPALAKGLAGGSAGLLGIGAAGTVAAGGLLAAAAAIAAVVAAAIAIPVVVGFLLKLSTSAAETGSKFHDLSQQTGVSVELISSLAPVADDSNGSIEQLALGIGKFNKLIGQAAEGSREAKNDLKLLGLEPKAALENSEAALEKVFKRIIDLKSGTEQVIVAQKAFGKSGAELIPTIIATGGNIEAVKKKAIELGVYWTGAGAAAADEYGDKLSEIRRIGEGFANSLGRVLIPELLKLARILAHEMPEAGGAFGRILGFIATMARGAAYQILLVVAAAKTLRDVPKAIGQSIISGNPLVAPISLGDSFLRNRDELLKIANTPSPSGPPASQSLTFPRVGGGGGKQHKGSLPDVVESALGLDRAQIEAAFNLLKDFFAREEKLLDQKRLSIEQFYAEKTRLETASAEAELLRIKSLEDNENKRFQNALKNLKTDKSITDEKERQSKIAIETQENEKTLRELDERRQIAARDRAAIAPENDQKKLADLEELHKKLVSLDEDAAALEGLQSLDAITDKYRELTEQIKAQLSDPKVPNDVRTNLLEQLEIIKKIKEAEIERAQVANVLAIAHQKIALIDADIAIIQAKHSGNVIEEYRARLLIKPLLDQQVAILQAALDRAEAMAESQQDPKTIEALKRQLATLEEMKRRYKDIGREIKDTFFNALESGIENLILSFNDIIAGTKSVGEAFREMALSIIVELEKIIAKMIALKLITAALKIFSGSAGGDSGGGGGFGEFFGGGSAAQGGWFAGSFGPGGPVSAAPGGRIIQVAEGGHDEMVVTTDPRHASRSARLLGRFIRRTGILPRFAAGGFSSESILSNISDRLPRFAMGDFVSADNLEAASAGAGNFSLNQTLVFPGVKDYRSFRQNEGAIKRDLARAAEQGVKATRGQR